MKQLIVDYIPFEITPQQITESMSTNDGNLLLKVYYKDRSKNQNGRVYPKDLLMREKIYRKLYSTKKNLVN